MSGRRSRWEPAGLFGLAGVEGYRRGGLRADAIAGVTVWAVLVPESFAYATIAGVPPVVGLYAAVPALVLYALLGTSRHLVVGPMSATAALSAGIVAGVAADDAQFVALTAGLAIVTGVLGVLAGLLRFGFVAALISAPVLKGFIIGLALTIVVGQLPKLLGVAGGDGTFVDKLAALLGELGSIDPATVAVGGLSLAAVLLLRRWLPLVPGALLVVLVSIAASWLVDLPQAGVAVVGEIEPGLPTLGLPAGLNVGDYLAMLVPAAGLLLVGFAEGLGAARTYAARVGYDVDANRELVGLGAANLGAGLSAGMVVNGSLSKTAVNGTAGARTQVSNLVVAALTVVTLLFLTGLFELLPEATLAAVVVAAVVELVDVPALRRLYRAASTPLVQTFGFAARADFLAAIVTLAAVLLLDILPGLLVGVLVSLLLLLYRSSRPRLSRLVPVPGTTRTLWLDADRYPEDAAQAQDEQVLVLRVEAGLYFANADHIREAVGQACGPQTQAVVLDLATTPFIDVTAAAMLDQLSHDLRRRGIRLLVAKSVGQVRDVITATLEQAPTFYPTVTEAVAAASGTAPSPGGMPR